VAKKCCGEYVASLGVDIGLQKVDEELATLPGKYAQGGGLTLIGWDGAKAPARLPIV
jgi:hypothetical protein